MPDASGAFAAALHTPASSAPPTEPTEAPGVPAAPAALDAGAEASFPGSPEDGPPKQSRWYPRFQELNTRMKAAEEARQQAERQANELAWAKAYPRTHVEQLNLWARWMDTDPVGFYRYYQSQLEAHPEYSQALKAHAGDSAPDQKPEPDLRTEDGTTVYSAAQQAKLDAWKERGLDAKLAERLKPFEDARAQADQERRQAALTQWSRETARSEVRTAEAWPRFNESRVAIKAAMEANPRLTLPHAYIQVVVPGLGQAERQRVLSDLRQQAVAATVNPAPAAPGAPKDYGKPSVQAFREALGG